MNSELWPQIEVAFYNATNLSTAARMEYLGTLPAEVRGEVESLLAAEELPLTFTGEILTTIAEIETKAPGNQRLGPYRILGQLGSGGMGSVYKAVRDDDVYQKTVAIKIIRAALAQTGLEQRFIAERQILAQLEHPYIARLIDGGTQEGLPYIVMEYIEGVPIDQYVREQNLSQRDRLILFRKVCEALTHAHQRLVVHRDLKPGNILVQADGTPRLLDFGIAKLLDQPSLTPQTQTGWMLMTPDYASPEQVRGDAISVSSDIYSLGVILYELLTGRRPYILKNYSPTEIQQAICTGAIPRPCLDTDLDTIVLTALHLDPVRRYSSVEKLSDDIRLYLAGQPISARPDTFFYRTTKFIERNRIAVTLATILLITILGGAALVYREGLRSQRRFTQVRAIANRVLNEFDNEAVKLPGNTQLRSVMVRASMEYLDSLAAESTEDADLRHEVALAYQKVGDILGYPRAPNLDQPFEAALAYNKAITLCEANRDEPYCAGLLAVVYAHYGALVPRLGKSELSRGYFDKAMAMLTPKSTYYTQFEVRHGFAQYLVLNGHQAEAVAALEPMFALPLSNQMAMHVRHLASNAESHRGDIVKAARLLDEALELSKAAGRTSVGLERSAALLHHERARLFFSRQGPSMLEPCLAIPHAREAAETGLKISNLERRRTSAIQTIDILQVYLGALAACPSAKDPSPYPQLLELYEQIGLAPEPAQIGEGLRLASRGDTKGALELLEPLLKKQKQLLDSLRSTAEVYLQLNRPQDALQLLRPALDLAVREGNKVSFDHVQYLERSLPLSVLLGDALTQTGRGAEAIEVWQAAVARVPQVSGPYPLAPSTRYWKNQLLSRLK